jgi:LysR family cys regulon transcriptional activator
LFEAELGSPLFERQGKKLVSMTPLGSRIMAEVAAINQAKNNIKSIAADFLDSDKGTLHIATTHTQAKYFLPMAIQRFRKKYPNVNIYMVQASPEQLIKQLHTREADIAICTEKIDQDADLVLEKCYEWHHAIIMPHGHPLSTGDITLEKLASFPILTYSFGFTGRSAIDKAFQATGLEMDVILSAADTDIIKTYVRLGIGVGVIADIAYDPIMDQDLVVRSLSHLIPSSFAKIAYLKHNYLPLYSQHFISELLTAAKEFS